MADLIAQGNEIQHRWRRTLRTGERVVLGRTAKPWAVPWDSLMSRHHVELCWQNDALHVKKLDVGRNPVFFRGRESEEFDVQPGQHFVIGETRFTLVQESATIASEVAAPLQEQSFSAQYLRGVRFHNADHRMEVLSRLPDVIAGAERDDQLFVRLVNMLLAGISRASAVALVYAPEDATEDSPANVLHWDRRLNTGGQFQPSRKLILEAIRQKQTVLHVWTTLEDSRATKFTAAESQDWAFCTPVPGEECAGWAVYVAGRFAAEFAATPADEDPGDLRQDIKFTEIVAGTLSSLRKLGLLQRKQATLSQFFPPAVLNALETRGAAEVLAPKLADVSVLFCDLRGFSHTAEQDAGDLMGLLQRVSKALGVMNHHILDQDGVVGDFQGDAAMGFWGWPLAQSDMILRACQAALAIRQQFEAAALRPGHPLADFRVGIGLATGHAVAGGIGAKDQLNKVTVFGPVVNLASRLEGMTKILQGSILIDEATAREVREKVSVDVARCRRVAKVKPYGLDTALEVSELLPPEAEYKDLTAAHIEAYEAALDRFMEGEWSEAIKLLHRVPPEDRVKDFLTEFIISYKRTPPPNWDGVIVLDTKG
jgi:adenylate cyclase